MTTIITRKALELWGGHNDLPADLAYVVSDAQGRRVVTWADVMADPRNRQRRTLEWKRRADPWRAVKVWVAYFDQWLMGGWQAFVENRDGRTWIDRDGQDCKAPLMELFPLVLPFAGDRDRWEDWKAAFAQAYRRRVQDGRPLGVQLLWRRGCSFRKP